jgi:hypothetical protein
VSIQGGVSSYRRAMSHPATVRTARLTIAPVTQKKKAPRFPGGASHFAVTEYLALSALYLGRRPPAGRTFLVNPLPPAVIP